MDQKTKHLPDVSSSEKSNIYESLDFVGMSSIEMPIKLMSEGKTFYQSAKISAYVSLDSHDVKGIHMSRLYLILQEMLEENVFSSKLIKQILQSFVTSQEGISESSKLQISYLLPVKRKALISDTYGWRQYPITVEGIFKDGEFKIYLVGEVLYSSTCPCSAALARQLVKNNFLNDFDNMESIPKADVSTWIEREESILATPHAQRSVADFKVEISDDFEELSIKGMIDKIEDALGTPVQAAVKRQDEQEFALLNGRNLMFCEDAARKLKKLFKSLPEVKSYWAKVSHKESLHPHDASAEIFSEI